MRRKIYLGENGFFLCSEIKLTETKSLVSQIRSLALVYLILSVLSCCPNFAILGLHPSLSRADFGLRCYRAASLWIALLSGCVVGCVLNLPGLRHLKTVATVSSIIRELHHPGVLLEIPHLAISYS